MEVKNNNSAQDKYGNKSKPLLCEVYSLDGIELFNDFLNVIDDFVFEPLSKIDDILDNTLLLNNELFQLKMRLFLKLKKDLEKVHAIAQTGNIFTSGSWKYKGESLSRRC